MQLAGISLAKVFFLAGLGSVIAANFVAFVILGEVNGRRPADQQHSMLFSNVRFFQIWDEHERLFPQSARRGHFVLCFLTGLACCLVAVILAVFST